MLLCDHPEFDQAILAAADLFKPRGLRPAVIEKDYYVTEALRQLAKATPRNQLIFKGGTSLSKGWNLIQRFSEDIDLFLDVTTFSPPLGEKATRTELDRLAAAVANHPGLTLENQKSELSGRTYVTGRIKTDHLRSNQTVPPLSPVDLRDCEQIDRTRMS